MPRCRRLSRRRQPGPGLGPARAPEVDLVIGGRPLGSGRFNSLATRPNVLVLVAAADRSDPVPDGRRTVSVERVGSEVLLLREAGSGTRSTAEELLDELGISPTTLNLGSNGAIRESVLVGLGITLISRDAVGRELDDGSLEERICAILPRQRAWHVVARAATSSLPPPGSSSPTWFAPPARPTATASN